LEFLQNDGLSKRFWHTHIGFVFSKYLNIPQNENYRSGEENPRTTARGEIVFVIKIKTEENKNDVRHWH